MNGALSALRRSVLYDKRVYGHMEDALADRGIESWMGALRGTRAGATHSPLQVGDPLTLRTWETRQTDIIPLQTPSSLRTKLSSGLMFVDVATR